MPPPDRLVFFLGGHDLEMVTLRDLLAEHAPGRWHDCGLSWGARASAYAGEIARARGAGLVPVLIELEDDLGLGVGAGDVVVVDHHGDRAGHDRPTSLHQVFALLGLDPAEWSRWHDLVAANDRGHIRALTALGATREEIVRVRSADRAAQGITAAQEEQGARAAANAQVLAGGRLTLVALPHNRTAAAADRLEPALGGPGYENLLILSPDVLSFFGAGRLVLALSQTHPGGWFGGDLPEHGFWGHPVPLSDVLDFLLVGVRADANEADDR
jgi:hypothetical protein